MASMNKKPIFLATHPRACSTAFERTFMTRRDILECAHEPFGDAWYYGPERMNHRMKTAEAREKSGFAKTTYKDVLKRLDDDSKDGKRVFLKDMANYLYESDGKPTAIAVSLRDQDTATPHTNGHVNGTTTATGSKSSQIPAKDDSTALPLEIIKSYHFAFLIRHPRRSIPSFYRCTVPPLDTVTNWGEFVPSECGYHELRRLFDYVKANGLIGGDSGVQITVVDADDLMNHPAEYVEKFCDRVGIDYSPKMLQWGDEENQEYAAKRFEKWWGFHHDAIESTCFKPRSHAQKVLTEEQEDEEWQKKYGAEAAKMLRETVNDNVEDYEYLKSFAMTV